VSLRHKRWRPSPEAFSASASGEVGDNRWQGGKVKNHKEVAAVDQAFWDRAGRAVPLFASLELAFQAWTLASRRCEI
jgi:hypothetical protein